MSQSLRLWCIRLSLLKLDNNCIPLQIRRLVPQIPITWSRHRDYHLELLDSPLNKEDIVLNENSCFFSHYINRESVGRLLDSLINGGKVKNTNNVFLGTAINALTTEVDQNTMCFWPFVELFHPTAETLEKFIVRAFYYDSQYLQLYADYRVLYSVFPNSPKRELGTVISIVEKYL